MPPRYSPAMEWALKNLPVDTWMRYEDVRERVMRAVPPHQAVHMAEHIRLTKAVREQGKAAPRIKNRDRDYQIRVGAKHLAAHVLRNAHFERKGDMIRLRSEEEMAQRAKAVTVKRAAPYSKMAETKPDEAARLNALRIARMKETRIRARGLDPATFKSQAQLKRERVAYYNSLTPEQQRIYRSEIRKKAAQTRARKRQAASTDDTERS